MLSLDKSTMYDLY